MKKLVFILIAFITFNSVNAQSEPGKKETFNFIVDLIEGACDLSPHRNFRVVSRDDNNFTLTIKAEGSVLNGVTYVQNYYTEFKSLNEKSKIGSSDASRYYIYFNKIIKSDIRYSNGRNGDYSSDKKISFDLCDSEKSKKMDKAINHFLKLMKGEGSFFDD